MGGAQSNKPVPMQDVKYQSGKDSSQFFVGPEAGDETIRGMVKPLVRVDSNTSIPVANDPRVATDNTISRRLATFATVTVSAMLLATLAFTAMTTVSVSSASRQVYVKAKNGTIHAEEQTYFSWLNLISLSLMCFVTVACMFTVVIIGHQMYLVGRLMTASSLGFEIGTSLYMSPTFTALRHLATHSFFVSAPVFLVACALMTFEKIAPSVNWQTFMTSAIAFVICGTILLGALFSLYSVRKQEKIFSEKRAQLNDYESPLRQHLMSSARGESPGANGSL